MQTRRNTAAGSVRQLDPGMTASRNLEIYIYAIGDRDGDGLPDNHWAALEQLRDRGLRISPHNRICFTMQEVEEYYLRVVGGATRPAFSMPMVWW